MFLVLHVAGSFGFPWVGWFSVLTMFVLLAFVDLLVWCGMCCCVC